MPANVNDRLTELEIQLTHQMRLYESLNEVVIDQSKRLDTQQRAIKQLVAEVQSLKSKGGASDAGSMEDERPPHY